MAIDDRQDELDRRIAELREDPEFQGRLEKIMESEAGVLERLAGSAGESSDESEDQADV